MSQLIKGEQATVRLTAGEQQKPTCGLQSYTVAMFITSLITHPHDWPAALRNCTQGGLPALSQKSPEPSYLAFWLQAPPAVEWRQIFLELEDIFWAFKIWQNTRTDFWVSTVTNSWTYHEVLEFPATGKGLSQTSPILNPHSIPNHWHSHIMDEETTLETLSNLPTCKEAEPCSSPDPPILVHAELSSQEARGPLRKRITTEPLQNLLASWMTPLLLLSHTQHENQINRDCFQLTGTGSENCHVTCIQKHPRQNKWYQATWNCLSLQRRIGRKPHYQHFLHAWPCTSHSQRYVIARNFS